MVTLDSIKQCARDKFTGEKLKLIEAWINAKEGIVDHHDLVGVKDDFVGPFEFRFYWCPNGKEHLASVRLFRRGLDKVAHDLLTCSICDKQWMIYRRPTAEFIKEEEEKMMRLIDSAPAVVAKVVKKRGWSEETIAFLKDTHGIDRWLAEHIYKNLATTPPRLARDVAN